MIRLSTDHSEKHCLKLNKQSTAGMLMRRVVNISLGILIGYLSIPVVMNLLNSKQLMNTSFDPLRIVNTYGAFGRYGQRSLGSKSFRLYPINYFHLNLCLKASPRNGLR